MRENVKTHENPDGLLTRVEIDYLKCIELEYGGLELLFQEDDAFWTELGAFGNILQKEHVFIFTLSYE